MKAAGFSDIDHIYAFEGYVNAAIFVEGLRGAGPALSRNSFRKALESMTDVDLGGIKIGYSPIDHKAIKNPFMAKLVGNKLVPVKTFQLSN